jgi:chloramphenicol 3-O-phosphotransferase
MHLVFLHGRAAAGKLTTARCLSDLVGYPVFHNHLVVDLLTTMFPFGSEPFVLLREQFWLAVLAQAARHDCSLIFTFTPELTVATGFPARVRAAVEPVGGTVCFVRLRVSDEEQERRVTNPGRAEFHKVTRIATLRSIAAQPAAEQPPVDLDVATDYSSAEASAALIASHFNLPRQVPQDRYPS